MSRHLAWFFLAVVMLVVSAPLQAVTYEVGGCKTGKSYVNFTTISAAVIGVPAGSTIEVCPGVYPEQVTVTKPLNLQGVISGNSGRAVITINNPTGGVLAPNVTSILGIQYYAQVLVQQATGGPVNITDVTVDGTGGNTNCSITMVDLAGIYYAPATSGTIKEVTARNQAPCGNGIYIENGADSTTRAITIENSSVHNSGLDAILALTNQFPPTLTAAIQGNFLTGNPAPTISTESIAGTIKGNLVTGAGIIDSVFTTQVPAGITISNNTVADIPSTGGWPGVLIRDLSTATGNKMSDVYVGFFTTGNGVTLKSNTTMNTATAAMFGCTSDTVSGNLFNDSQTGFDHPGSPLPSLSQLVNVGTDQTGSCP
jgi:hypothetical protein